MQSLLSKDTLLRTYYLHVTLRRTPGNRAVGFQNLPSQLFLYISLGFCLFTCGFKKTSDSTASWSAMPGLISTDLTKVGLSIRNRSKMLSPHVRGVTSCARLNSSKRSMQSSYWCLIQNGSIHTGFPASLVQFNGHGVR